MGPFVWVISIACAAEIAAAAVYAGWLVLLTR
jgi:hypothetical protein